MVIENFHLIHIKTNLFESVVNPSQHTKLMMLVLPSVLLGLQAPEHKKDRQLAGNTTTNGKVSSSMTNPSMIGNRKNT